MERIGWYVGFAMRRGLLQGKKDYLGRQVRSIVFAHHISVTRFSECLG